MGLWCQPANLTPEEGLDQATRVITTSVEINVLDEGITRITTTIDTMTTGQDHHASQTEVSLQIEAETRNTHNHLQRQDKTHPSRIFAGNPDQIHLNLQCLIDLETKT